MSTNRTIYILQWERIERNIYFRVNDLNEWNFIQTSDRRKLFSRLNDYYVSDWKGKETRYGLNRENEYFLETEEMLQIKRNVCRRVNRLIFQLCVFCVLLSIFIFVHNFASCDATSWRLFGISRRRALCHRHVKLLEASMSRGSSVFVLKLREGETFGLDS